MKDILVGRKLLQPIFERLYRVCLSGMNYGRGAYIEKSGELFLINQIRSILSPSGRIVVFDVGANNGQYLGHFISNYEGQFAAHCFEPSRSAFAELAKRYETDRSVVLNNVGLGNRSGTTNLYYDEDGSAAASFFPINSRGADVLTSKAEVVSVTTLEKYAEQNDIKTIDFLKLDVEGNELAVFQGASKLLAEGRIFMIQFEVGPASLRSGALIYKFFDLLDGYTIHRLLSDGMRRINYKEQYEIFLTTNYVALRADLQL
mgnify:FL=1